MQYDRQDLRAELLMRRRKIERRWDLDRQVWRIVACAIRAFKCTGCELLPSRQGFAVLTVLEAGGGSKPQLLKLRVEDSSWSWRI